MSRFALNWDDLQYFLAVARHQQLTRAAEQMKTSHVTMGRRLDRLEQSLTTRLFDRGPKGYSLTAEGRQLLEIAEEIEGKALQLPQSLTHDPAQVEGTLRLNMPEGFCHQFCAQILPTFTAAFPKMALEVVAIQQLTTFTPNMNDLSVVLDPPQGASWHSEPVAHYALHVYGHQDYLRRKGMPQTREELAAHDFIGYIGEMIFMPALDYLAEVSSQLRPKLKFSSIFSQLQAVRNGQGLAVLPDFLARQYLDLVPVLTKDVSLRRSYWLACRRELRFAPREAQVIDRLIEATKVMRPSMLPNEGA